MRFQTKLFASLCALGLAGQVSAGTTWTFTGGGAPGGVTVAGYANTGDIAGKTASQNAANNGAIQTIQNASTGWYSGGVGVNNADGCSSGSTCDVGDLANSAPEHAIDNNQRYDMVLLSFANIVKLTNLSLGWWQTDSDVSVMAYGGAGAPTLIGKTYDQLLGLGWTSIGNYANVQNTNVAINSGNVSSSYWLIGAFNPLANGNKYTNGLSGDTNYDYIKLASVTGVIAPPNKAPEPGSLALAGLALLAAFVLNRRSAR